MKKYLLILFVCTSFPKALLSQNTQIKSIINENLPYLKRYDNAFQLLVKGKPLLMLAGETGNSSSSDLNYMKKVWPTAVMMHLNTLVVPVYWELLEPEESEFTL